MKYRWSYFYHRKGRAMKLYFVRHGETEWNVKKKIQGKTDIPLNENGIRQAKELACQLVEEDISVKHVYHSPQLRAAETARIVCGSSRMRPVFRWMDWWR
ncbi:MAG: phosphoglycerate mutase family protein [Roseburia inulinivorans]